ncbi:transcription factor jumonji, partial [Melanomma pulvis-pyrius CBS 109.77]
VPGVTTPYLYYSDESNTPATMHVEDAGLGSVNLLVAGAPKVWLFIPPSRKSDFEQLMQRLFPETELSSCSQHVRHIGIVILAKTLRENQISFSLVHQHIGDMVVTLNDAYHQVLNEGPNAAVAINI